MSESTPTSTRRPALCDEIPTASKEEHKTSNVEYSKEGASNDPVGLKSKFTEPLNAQKVPYDRRHSTEARPIRLVRSDADNKVPKHARSNTARKQCEVSPEATLQRKKRAESSDSDISSTVPEEAGKKKLSKPPAGSNTKPRKRCSTNKRDFEKLLVNLVEVRDSVDKRMKDMLTLQTNLGKELECLHRKLLPLQSVPQLLQIPATKEERYLSEVQNVCAEVVGSSVLVKWEDKEHKHTSKYVIKFHGNLPELEIEASEAHHGGDSFAVKINGQALKPMHDYRLQVFALNRTLSASDMPGFTMKQTPPPKPIIHKVTVNFTDEGSKQLLVDAEVEDYTGEKGREITKYTILYHNEMGESKKNTIAFESAYALPIDENDGREFLDFQLKIKNEFGWSPLSNAIEFTLDDLKPNKPEWLTNTEDAVTSSSVELVWKEPSKNNGAVKGYEIEWSTSVHVHLKDNEFCDRFTVNGLRSDTEYRFKVYPIDSLDKRCEPSDEITVRTRNSE